MYPRPEAARQGWAVECAALLANTQGRTKREAYEMMVDWVRSMFDLDCRVVPTGPYAFNVIFEDAAPALAAIFARHRAASGKTLQEIADAIGVRSRTVVKQAETGKSELGISRLTALLGALGVGLVLDVAESDPAPAQRLRRRVG